MDIISNIDEGSSYKYSKLYTTSEFPIFYRQHLLNEETEEEEFISFTLFMIFNNERIKGKRLLDVGSGPTAHRIASASKTFAEIYLSEYAAMNRKELQKWLKSDPSALDWSHFLGMTAKFEEYGNTVKGVKVIESRIRQKIKKVLPCDILQKQVIQEDIGKFDVVLTSYCLECTCPTADAFKSAIKKLEEYIIPGGALVMVITMESKYCIYVNNSEKMKFYDLFVTEELLKDSLRETGLEIKHWYFNKDIGEDDTTKCKGILVLSALKNA